MADSLNRINTGLFPGTKKGAFHSICSGSYACGSGWRRCGSGWRRLLIYNRLFFAVTLSREALTGPDVRLFLLAGEQVETGRNVRPVFESPKQYLFGTQQAVFSVTRNIFGNAKPLARKGRENDSEVVVFYRGHGGPTRNFSRQKLFERSSQKQRIP